MSSSSTFLARRFSSEKSLAFFIQLSYIFFGRVDHKSSTIWTSFLTIPKILASTTLFNAPTDHLGMAKDGKSQLWVNASTSFYNHPCFGWFRVENASIFPKWLLWLSWELVSSWYWPHPDSDVWLRHLPPHHPSFVRKISHLGREHIIL